jgi:hypothetical protein
MLSAVPLNTITDIKGRFDFKIYLYHAMSNDYDLVLAELLLYAYYRIITKKQSVSLEL